MESTPCFKLFGFTILPVNEEKNKSQLKVFGFPIFPEKDYPPKIQENIPKIRRDLGASPGDGGLARLSLPRSQIPTPFLKEEEEPDLSPRFRRDLGASPGEEVSLIFRKRLFNSDVNGGLARLSLPRSQILTQFLNEEEERFLQQKDEKGKPLKYTVEVIDPSHQLRKLTLVRWNYDNSGPKSEQSSKKRKRETRSDPSWSYMLSGKWRELVDSNGLEEGNQIQVWAFRGGDGMLRFAIVNLEKESAQARDLEWGRRRKRGSRRSATA